MTLASSPARLAHPAPIRVVHWVAAAAILGFKRSRHLQRLAEPTLHLPGLEDPRSAALCLVAIAGWVGGGRPGAGQPGQSARSDSVANFLGV
jgi:hypothetical protein